MLVMSSLSRVSCTGLSFLLTHSHFQMKCSARCRRTVSRYSDGRGDAVAGTETVLPLTRVLTNPYAPRGMFVWRPGLHLSTSLLSVAFGSSGLNCVLLCLRSGCGPQLLFPAALSVIGPWREPLCHLSVTSACFTHG